MAALFEFQFEQLPTCKIETNYSNELISLQVVPLMRFENVPIGLSL
jgi:hypothetical protein